MAPQTSTPRFHRHWFADLKARALARWVSSAADDRLQWVMSSRLRSLLLWQIFRTIGQRAEPDRRLDAVVEFRIRGRTGGGVDRYQLVFADGRCSASRRCGKAALMLELEPEAFLLLVAGLISPQRLWIAGKIRLRGDMMLALALPRALNPLAPGESLRGESLRKGIAARFPWEIRCANLPLSLRHHIGPNPDFGASSKTPGNRATDSL